jgi:uncharacterized protein
MGGFATPKWGEGCNSNGSPTYSEFTGPTFTPDGDILFANILTPGITLAISGPWSRYLG